MRIALALLSMSLSLFAAGPVSRLYLTGNQISPGLPNENRINVVQGSGIVNTWTTKGASPTAEPNYPSYESAIAVGTAVRTLGQQNGEYGAEYTLTGTPTSNNYLNSILSVSPTPPVGEVQLHDGTTDGQHNYAIDGLTGTVYQADLNWQNAVPLLALPTTDTTSSMPYLWVGITYDATDQSLWVSSHLISEVRHYTLGGTLLGSFNPSQALFGIGLMTALALDPADGTLWVQSINGTLPDQYTLVQFSKAGVLLSTVSYSSLQQFDVNGGEFELTPSPLSPNLQVSALSAPNTASAGSTIGVTDTTANGGEGFANASATDIWLSTDRVLSNDDARMGTRQIGFLAAGASSQGTTSVVVPSVPAETYYLIAQADGTSALDESNEGDNTRLKRINIVVDLPDLMTSLALNPSSPNSTSPTTVTVATSNIGKASAGPSVTRLYRSSNGSVDAGDTLLAEFSIDTLLPTQSSANAIAVTLPAGQYYLVTVADALSELQESSEKNNTKGVRVRVR